MTLPQGLDRARNRDLEGRERNPWTRRVLLLALALVIAAGLANQFGQQPATATVAAPGAELEVVAPERVRGGLYYQLRVTVHAERELEKARVVLGAGWLEGITINTIEPSPVGEASTDGDLSLELGRVPAGDDYVLWVQSQVNPTTVGARTATIELFDDETLLAAHSRTLVVFP